jgi:hypothetical protein
MRPRPYGISVICGGMNCSYAQIANSRRVSRYFRKLNIPLQRSNSLLRITPLTLEDAETYGTPLQEYSGHASLKRRTPVHSNIVKAGLFIVNHYTDISDFYMALDELNVTNPERLRPSWDT